MLSFGSACITLNCTRRNDRRTGVRNLGLIVFYRCKSTTVFSALCFAFILGDKLQPLADQVLTSGTCGRTCSSLDNIYVVCL